MRLKSNELKFYDVKLDPPYKYIPMIAGNEREYHGGVLLHVGEGFDEIKLKLNNDEAVHLIVLLQENVKKNLYMHRQAFGEIESAFGEIEL